jgi:NTP pyrophosphatase (non-canonical NTP hydrolase)
MESFLLKVENDHASLRKRSHRGQHCNKEGARRHRLTYADNAKINIMKSYTELSREITAWADHNFDYHNPAFGVAEEAGELVHCVLKNRQGIRGKPEEFKASAADALADATIFALHWIGLSGQQLMEEELRNDLNWCEERMLANLFILSGRFIESKLTAQRFIVPILCQLGALAQFYGLDLITITNDTWAEVSKRDWRKFPMNGLTE